MALRQVRVGSPAVLAALLVLVSCTAVPAPLPVPQPVVTPGSRVVVEVDERPFELYVGTGYPAGEQTALVVALHGYTGTAQNALDFFGLQRVADERGLLIALPQGTSDSRGNTFWNAAGSCCDFTATGVDDSGYLSAVIATTIEQYPVDPRRVFVVGHSNGGFMAHRLACEHADQVAAIVSMAGSEDVGHDCTPSRPVSVLQVHGDADDVIRFDGGSNGPAAYKGAEQLVADWRERNSCPTPAQTGTAFDADSEVAGEETTPVSWGPCAQDTEVALWELVDAGHAPGLTPAYDDAVADWLQARARA